MPRPNDFDGTSDHYTAMVMAASNYSEMQASCPRPSYTQRCGQTGGSLSYRSRNYCSSANSSSSVNSSSFAPPPAGATAVPSAYRHQRQASMSFGSDVYVPALAVPSSQQTAALPTAATTTTTTAAAAQPASRGYYTHNPYASSCATSSCTSANTSHDVSIDSSYQSFHATYADTAETGGMHDKQAPFQTPNASVTRSVDANSLAEQFVTVIGNIPATACTSRGRHLLVSVMRLHHPDKLSLIYDELQPHMSTVSLDPNGCYVVRTLVEVIQTEDMLALVPYFLPATVQQLATTSQHTRRVLQSMFERHRSEGLNPIVDVIASDARRLAMTQQGCIAVMRTMEFGLPAQRQLLISRLLPSLPTLTMDPYGNYVVQSIIDNMDGCTPLSVVCAAFAGHWVPLSCNKFASNVMEKVVRRMDADARQQLVAELVLNANNLQCLLQDGFGNFVLQAIIDSSTDVGEFGRVDANVSALLFSSPYGHKIEAKLQTKRQVFTRGM